MHIELSENSDIGFLIVFLYDCTTYGVWCEVSIYVCETRSSTSPSSSLSVTEGPHRVIVLFFVLLLNHSCYQKRIRLVDRTTLIK